MVEAGIGVSALPKMATPYGDHPPLVTRAIGNPVVSRTIGIVRRRGALLSPTAERATSPVRSNSLRRLLKASSVPVPHTGSRFRSAILPKGMTVNALQLPFSIQSLGFSAEFTIPSPEPLLLKTAAPLSPDAHASSEPSTLPQVGAQTAAPHTPNGAYCTDVTVPQLKPVRAPRKQRRPCSGRSAWISINAFVWYSPFNSANTSWSGVFPAGSECH